MGRFRSHGFPSLANRKKALRAKRHGAQTTRAKPFGPSARARAPRAIALPSIDKCGFTGIHTSSARRTEGRLPRYRGRKPRGCRGVPAASLHHRARFALRGARIAPPQEARDRWLGSVPAPRPRSRTGESKSAGYRRREPRLRHRASGPSSRKKRSGRSSANGSSTSTRTAAAYPNGARRRRRTVETAVARPPTRVPRRVGTHHRRKRRKSQRQPKKRQ